MIGRKHRGQASLFYELRLEDMVPKDRLSRRINVFATSALGDLHQELGRFYSDIRRPSIDPELLIRMLIVGYASALSGSCAKRRSCILLRNSSTGSISTMRYRITLLSRGTG